MDAELKSKWVAALRSGQYTQGYGTLRDENGNLCCLGVLATITNMEIREDDGTGEIMVDGHKCGYRPLEELTNKKTHDLAMRNDGKHDDHKWTFPELADYIEANL